MLKIIVAMANDRVIGQDNRMPWHIPEDLAHFRQTTMGHSVIMGRNTYLSIGKALEGRKNIVLSRNTEFNPVDAIVYRDFKAAIADYPEAFIIGGANVFAQALPYARQLYITHIDMNIPGDTRFPEINLSQYQLQNCTSSISRDGKYPLRFCLYQR